MCYLDYNLTFFTSALKRLYKSNLFWKFSSADWLIFLVFLLYKIGFDKMVVSIVKRKEIYLC